MTDIVTRFEGIPKLTPADAPSDAPAPPPVALRKPEKYHRLMAVMMLALATALRDHGDFQEALSVINTAIRALRQQLVPNCLHPELIRLKADILLHETGLKAAMPLWMSAFALAVEYGANHFALRAGLRMLQQKNSLHKQKMVEGVMKKVDTDMAMPEYALAYRLTSIAPIAEDDSATDHSDLTGSVSEMSEPGTCPQAVGTELC